jgi:hypothetical protein
MNFVLCCIFLCAAFGGFLSAMKEMRECRQGKIRGVKSSKSLFSYLFCDHD